MAYLYRPYWYRASRFPQGGSWFLLIKVLTKLYHTFGYMSSVKSFISTAAAVLYNLYFEQDIIK